MQINDIKRNTKRKKHVQVGRGGKRGKTSGRGMNGQKSRPGTGKILTSFVGGQKARAGHKIRPEIRDMIKKLPKQRGRGKNINTPNSEAYFVVNVSTLDSIFENGDKVTPQTLFEKGLLRKNKGMLPKVKILGQGDLSKKLQIKNCAVSGSAVQKIEEKGGKIE